MADVKNIEDVLDAALVIVNGAVEMRKDGKTDLSEIVALVVSSAGPVIEAVKGVSEIKGEFSDMDLDEAKLLLAKAVSLSQAIVDLVKGPKG